MATYTLLQYPVSTSVTVEHWQPEPEVPDTSQTPSSVPQPHCRDISTASASHTPLEQPEPEVPGAVQIPAPRVPQPHSQDNSMTSASLEHPDQEPEVLDTARTPAPIPQPHFQGNSMASASYALLDHPFSTSRPLEQPEPEVPNTAQTPAPISKPHFQDVSFSKEGRIKHSHPMFQESKLMAAVKFIWRTSFLPVLAVAYMAFCFMCHFKLIRVQSISDPLDHLNLVKSGVTSISILYVSLSLLPITSLISDLKSEEFFRTLSRNHSGVPLSSINAISLPSYGLRESLTTLFRRDASGYFATAFIASLIALATSTVAPAILSVDTILFDGEITALSVGAINRNSVLNTSDLMQLQVVGPSDTISTLSPQSGAVAWAESSLHTNVSFQSPIVNETAYIIPTPPNLPRSMRGKWISDVAVLKPTCEWIAPHTQAVGVNFSSFESGHFSMNLTSKNIGITIDATSFNQQPFAMQSMEGSWFNGLGSVGIANGSKTIYDLDTMDDLTNGAMAWMLHRCTAGCDTFGLPQTINLTFGPEVNFTHVVDIAGNSADITFLYCTPNAQIETHQISNDGQGALTVGRKVSTPQGNLHPAQTYLMMSFTFLGFDTAGPTIPGNVSDLGNEALFNFIFGNPSPIPTELSPLPISQISTTYGQILTSAAKPFVNGSLGTALVPARMAIKTPVFAASLSHVIASTVLYALLAAFGIGCYFRRHVPPFTFLSVAASLAKSDMSPILDQLKESGSPLLDNDPVAASFSGARVLLEEGQVLRLRV